MASKENGVPQGSKVGGFEYKSGLGPQRGRLMGADLMSPESKVQTNAKEY